MKSTSKLTTIVLASAAFMVAGCSTCHHTSTAWEYRVVRGVTHSSDLQDKLNQAGAEGFAIASSQTLRGDANTTPVTIVILKKAKP